jgi:hypothetical protein
VLVRRSPATLAAAPPRRTPCSLALPRTTSTQACTCLAHAPRHCCTHARAPERPAHPLAGEPQGPAPPLALPRSDQAPIRRSVASGGLRISRRCLPTQPPFESAPGRPSSVFSGAAPPREHAAGAASAAARAPFTLSRSISDPRPRLDRHTSSSRAIRSRSDGSHPRVPVRCGCFA